MTNRLAAQDLDTFLPRYLDRTSWSDRLKQIRRPLFPGYLFARLPWGDCAMALRTRGVVQILGPVPDTQIETLKIACQASAKLNRETYRTGEMVRILSGPFEGCIGIVDRFKPNRLTLRIDLLKRAVSVEIDPKTRVERVR